MTVSAGVAITAAVVDEVGGRGGFSSGTVALDVEVDVTGPLAGVTTVAALPEVVDEAVPAVDIGAADDVVICPAVAAVVEAAGIMPGGAAATVPDDVTSGMMLGSTVDRAAAKIPDGCGSAPEMAGAETAPCVVKSSGWIIAPDTDRVVTAVAVPAVKVWKVSAVVVSPWAVLEKPATGGSISNCRPIPLACDN